MRASYRRCCGIDVHKKSVSVCVLPPVGQPEVGIKQERFGTFTRDLQRLRKWLGHCQVTEIVMESTGQYWRPVWNILEGPFPKLVLVNPLHVKALAGRKTDRLDARWLATRLERDDLKGSFIPPPEIRELRDLTRLRVNWLQDLNRIKNRIGQLCEASNIKVSSVASDLFGVSGRQMLAALRDGRHRIEWIARQAKGKLRSKTAQLESALQGTITVHQRQMLGRLLEQMETLERQVAELTEEIERRVACYQELIERLDTIPGIDRIAAWTVLAETGTDMSVFGDARHLASWAAVCPGSRESGGKRQSGRTRKGNRYLRRVLCQCAWAASHKQGSHLSALFRRIRARKGEQKAIMAVAHQLLTIIYHLVRDGGVYQELGTDYYDLRNKPKVTRKLVERLTRLGFSVRLEPIPEQLGQPGVAPTDSSPPSPSRKRGRPCKCAERGIPCKHGGVDLATNKFEINSKIGQAAHVVTVEPACN